MSDWRIDYANKCHWCGRIEPHFSQLFLVACKATSNQEVLMKLVSEGAKDGVVTFMVPLGLIHTDECEVCRYARSVADVLMQEP